MGTLENDALLIVSLRTTRNAAANPMGPEQPLPFPPEFADEEGYVESLLSFGTSSELLRTLCGGVHILDFFTRSPDLYCRVLPESWRDWFRSRDIMDILDLLIREDIHIFETVNCQSPSNLDAVRQWRNGPLPPQDLIHYIRDVRKHLLDRDFNSESDPPSSDAIRGRGIWVGMKTKKVHEVANFAQFVNRLTTDIAVYRKQPITHLVDFGSGQNYLGRALASQPYNKNIVAVESRPHVIEGAKNMDVMAGLKKKKKTNLVNKKLWREQMREEMAQNDGSSPDSKVPTKLELPITSPIGQTNSVVEECVACLDTVVKANETSQLSAPAAPASSTHVETVEGGHGTIQYIEHRIADGDLTTILPHIIPVQSETPDQGSQNARTSSKSEVSNPSLITISLHSCGNLLHHGLRTLKLTPHVDAVALIGCCYNLLTERLGPPSYKLPQLRPRHQRLEDTANARDPHGFPMSKRLSEYVLPSPPVISDYMERKGEAKSAAEQQHEQTPDVGIRLNITARMMAVQAPQNWSRTDSDLFFTRHFYRALLQRIFVDKSIVRAPSTSDDVAGGVAYADEADGDIPPPPIIIGTLGKFSYSSFVSYVRGAVTKLTATSAGYSAVHEKIAAKLGPEVLSDDEIRGYEERYRHRRHELSVVWTFMAFSAGVVEAMIVVDRYLWLREQPEVGKVWVEPVFEYRHSPRNLVVVGVRKPDDEVRKDGKSFGMAKLE